MAICRLYTSQNSTSLVDVLLTTKINQSLTMISKVLSIVIVSKNKELQMLSKRKLRKYQNQQMLSGR